jgi:hypothetical protein
VLLTKEQVNSFTVVSIVGVSHIVLFSCATI